MREVWVICDDQRSDHRMWTVACGNENGLDEVDTLPTKRRALSLARELCHREKPSRMIVKRMDGTTSRRHRYLP